MLKVQETQLVSVLQREVPCMSAELAVRRAKELIATMDERLEPNVRQWMDGEEITDVWVGKYCINAILAIRGDRDFLSALEAMNLYLQDPGKGELRIWRARR